jgi:hypothetical protein
MKFGFKLKALVAGAMMIVGGAASANMNIDTVNGDIYLNLWDQTTGSTFLFDTGLNQSTFNGNTTVFSQNLSGDTNYQAFIAAVGGTDVVTYNLVSQATGGVFTTGTSAPSGTIFNSKLNGANSAGGGVASQANGVSSSTSNSAYTTNAINASAEWGAADATWNTNLQLTADSAVGSALGFYSIVYGAGLHTSNTVRTVVSTFANTWLLDSAGNLTYNAVPVPAPFGLLLGGLALMGAISRRKQGAAEKEVDGAAA